MSHIQKRAPGPPNDRATATPAIFPVPRLPPNTAANAAKLENPEGPPLFSVRILVNASLNLLICNHFSDNDRYNPIINTIGTTIRLKITLTWVINATVFIDYYILWGVSAAIIT